VGWGFYERWALTAAESFLIPIKLWKCRRQESGGYISIQPTFLLPHRQYTLAVIYKVLCLRLLLGLTLKESLLRVFGDVPIPSYQTVQYWVKELRRNCGTWIGILQGEVGVEAFAVQVSAPAHLLTVLQRYLGGDVADPVLELRHGELLNRYRGSPLCRARC